MTRDTSGGIRWLSGHLAAAWSVAGVIALLGAAAWRLGRRGVETIAAGLAGPEWAALVVLTLVFVIGEGIFALDRRWVPAFLDRSRRLRDGGGTLLRLLAPLHGLALLGAPRRTLLRAWAGTTAIVAAVLVIRSLPEPWRGIVDFAVAAALAWGIVAIVRRLPAAWSQKEGPAQADPPPLRNLSEVSGASATSPSRGSSRSDLPPTA